MNSRIARSRAPHDYAGTASSPASMARWLLCAKACVGTIPALGSARALRQQLGTWLDVILLSQH